MKKYNRAIAFFIVMMFTAVICFGCGQEQENAPEPQDNDGNDTASTEKMTVSEITGYVLDNIVFQDQMNAISTDLFLGLYNLEKEAVAEAVVYESTGATAEEFAVIRTESSEAAEQVKNAIQSRVQSQKESFENYVPGELAKLEDPVIFEQNDIVVFIICNDNKGAEKLLEDMSK